MNQRVWLKRVVVAGISFGVFATVYEVLAMTPLRFRLPNVPSFVIAGLGIVFSAVGLRRRELRRLAVVGVILGVAPLAMFAAVFVVAFMPIGP